MRICQAKQMDCTGKTFGFEARCILKGDSEEKSLAQDPEDFYAPVESQKTIRALIWINARENCPIEECDVDDAYSLGNIDIYIRSEHLKNPTNILHKLEYDCLLKKF